MSPDAPCGCCSAARSSGPLLTVTVSAPGWMGGIGGGGGREGGGGDDGGCDGGGEGIWRVAGELVGIVALVTLTVL